MTATDEPQQSIPMTKMAYISAEMEASATVSGPPSTLLALFPSMEPFKNARKVKLPITAAFHASHLRRPDIGGILMPLAAYTDLPISTNVQVISTSSGQPIKACHYGELLEQILLDILQEPLHWSDIVQQLVSESHEKTVQVLCVGPVRAADSLSRYLKNSRVNSLESTELRAPPADTSKRSNDIAIVGFASRIPEAETLAEAWKLLEAGRDVHKKVSLRIWCQTWHHS